MPVNYGGPLDFTDGDTYKRVTITNPDARPTSRILTGIIRIDVADEDDAGWVYCANVVSRTTGSFDVAVNALMMDGPATNDESPNETVDLVYTLE